MFRITALLITVTAAFAYVNHRFIRLPTTIGVMVISLTFSLGLVALGWLGFPQVQHQVEALFRAVDFNEVLMQGMLSLLLFGGLCTWTWTSCSVAVLLWGCSPHSGS